MNILISIIIGFALGSIPTAYILLKKIKNINITEKGSNNVGALNSFKVSQSKLIGFSVLLLDFLKGLFSVLVLNYFYPEEFLFPAIGLATAVIGHCFSPWINFKGGRGLATAAGGTAFLSPIVLGLWIAIWLISFLFRKSVHLSNIMATVLSLALVIYNGDILLKYANPISNNIYEFVIPFSIMFLVIISKHWEPLVNYFRQQKKQVRGKTENE